jgi:hypothetical protein
MPNEWFWVYLPRLKKEAGIKVIKSRSGETNARRIALLITDLFLEHNGDANWAGILERRIYEEVKAGCFTCDMIPVELNWEENKRKAKDKSWNPLKLAWEGGADKYLMHHPMIVYMTNSVLDILSTQDEEAINGSNQDVRKSQISRFIQCQTSTRDIRSKQANRIELVKRKGPALRSTRK